MMALAAATSGAGAGAGAGGDCGARVDRTTTTIVALCGQRGAGKDEVADVLCKEGGFVNLKFARPMKDALRGIFGLTEEDVDGGSKDTPHPTWRVPPRALMQWFGTDVMQHHLAARLPHVGRTFWSERMRQELERRAAAGESRVVISDLRFQHELDMLRALPPDRWALHAVRIERPRARGEASDAHESETAVGALGPVDAELLNAGTLEDLREHARGVLRRVLGDPASSG